MARLAYQVPVASKWINTIADYSLKDIGVADEA
jgi:hypothetical protein